MQVKIKYKDTDSFIKDEVVQNMKSRYGINCDVKVYPDDESPEAYIYFAIQELISMDQLEAYFDMNNAGYDKIVEELKLKTLKKVANIFDKVVEDNEKRIT